MKPSLDPLFRSVVALVFSAVALGLSHASGAVSLLDRDAWDPGPKSKAELRAERRKEAEAIHKKIVSASANLNKSLGQIIGTEVRLKMITDELKTAKASDSTDTENACGAGSGNARELRAQDREKLQREAGRLETMHKTAQSSFDKAASTLCKYDPTIKRSTEAAAKVKDIEGQFHQRSKEAVVSLLVYINKEAAKAALAAILFPEGPGEIEAVEKAIEVVQETYTTYGQLVLDQMCTEQLTSIVERQAKEFARKEAAREKARKETASQTGAGSELEGLRGTRLGNSGDSGNASQGGNKNPELDFKIILQELRKRQN